MIALAGSLWGTVGLFGKVLFNYGFDPKLVVFCRLFVGFLIMFIFILFKDKKLLKFDKRGLKYTALIGFFSQALFNLLYFETIKRTTIATAVILLYTAPIFLIIMGRIFYKELLSTIKISALVLCMIGCFLTVTGGALDTLNINSLGVLMGIGAGLTYALVTIISKAIIDDYHPLTIILYSFLFGWIFLVPFSHPVSLLYVKYSLSVVASIIGLGLIPTVLAYILYITGLSYGVEASKAGIICSMEIVVSVIISYLFFEEVILGVKLLGIVMALGSIFIIKFDKHVILPNEKQGNIDEKSNYIGDCLDDLMDPPEMI
ncbi:DMT family transporter [Clostridium tagluense]|uniref:DMT family transporter n=1 Tax=Clostridium tagluense TaxID=360422 RepID=UPI001CF5192F|nr:EamA family transporter [Clostridium tagluense]MCB2310315.1 DMT family transporter [Clostridium tagluense]MCB2315043.1 DMT family transporter [Clostridium tagluense]MCB2320015.1 DMT family transporter [Clostridium tagluense]MCB2324786.1 DMT family transporter [Clostridium tagluense]MCB2329760.1 DMT family transporter [Clostridium tagluense]